MADKDYTISFKTEADTSGAKETAEAVDQVTEAISDTKPAADKAADALDDVSIENDKVTRSSKSTTEALSKQQAESKDATQAADALTRAEKKLEDGFGDLRTKLNAARDALQQEGKEAVQSAETHGNAGGQIEKMAGSMSGLPGPAGAAAGALQNLATGGPIALAGALDIASKAVEALVEHWKEQREAARNLWLQTYPQMIDASEALNRAQRASADESERFSRAISAQDNASRDRIGLLTSQIALESQLATARAQRAKTEIEASVRSGEITPTEGASRIAGINEGLIRSKAAADARLEEAQIEEANNRATRIQVDLNNRRKALDEEQAKGPVGKRIFAEAPELIKAYDDALDAFQKDASSPANVVALGKARQALDEKQKSLEEQIKIRTEALTATIKQLETELERAINDAKRDTERRDTLAPLRQQIVAEQVGAAKSQATSKYLPPPEIKTPPNPPPATPESDTPEQLGKDIDGFGQIGGSRPSNYASRDIRLAARELEKAGGNQMQELAALMAAVEAAFKTTLGSQEKSRSELTAMRQRILNLEGQIKNAR